MSGFAEGPATHEGYGPEFTQALFCRTWEKLCALAKEHGGEVVIDVLFVEHPVSEFEKAAQEYLASLSNEQQAVLRSYYESMRSREGCF